MPNYLNYPDCAAAASHPLKIGDGYCNHGYGGNTLECGFDGGDCDDWNAKFPNCNTDYPMDIGNGSCMDNYGTNTAECDFDGGDCDYSNFMKKYPDCPFVFDTRRFGDGRCDGSYNTAECGFDGGDCGNPNPFPVWSVVGGVAGAFLFIAIVAVGIVIGKKKWNTSTMQEAASGGGIQTGNAKDDMNNQQEEPFPDVEATDSSARNIHKPVLQSQDNSATLGRELGSEASGEEEWGAKRAVKRSAERCER